jgi:hypothetical protein
MAVDQSGRFSEHLAALEKGDREALRALVPLTFKELRRLAHYHLQSERPDHHSAEHRSCSRGLPLIAGKPTGCGVAEPGTSHSRGFASDAANP